MNPELIFLLSDNIDGQGIYESHQRTLLDEVARVNAPAVAGGGQRAMVSTIQFIDRPVVYGSGGKGTLELIAEQNGGLYRFISAEQVGIAR